MSQSFPQFSSIKISKEQTNDSLLNLALGGVLVQIILLFVDVVSWFVTKPRPAGTTRPGICIKGLLVCSVGGLIPSHFYLFTSSVSKCALLLGFIITSHLLVWILHCVAFAFVVEPRWRRRENESYGVRWIVAVLCISTVGIWIASIVKSFHFEVFTANYGSPPLCQMMEPPKWYFVPWCLQLFSSLIFICLFKVAPHHPDYTKLPVSKARGLILLLISFGLNLAFFLTVYFSKESLTTVKAISLSIAANFFFVNQFVNEGPSLKFESNHSHQTSRRNSGITQMESSTDREKKHWKSTSEEPQFESVYPLNYDESGLQTIRSQKSLPFLLKILPKNRVDSSKSLTISGPVTQTRSASISTFPGLWAQRSPSIPPANERNDYFPPSPSSLRKEWTSGDDEIEIEMEIPHPSRFAEDDTIGLKTQVIKRYPPNSPSAQISSAISRASSSLMGSTNRKPSVSGYSRNEVPLDASASSESVNCGMSYVSNSDGSSTKFYPIPMKGKIPGHRYNNSSLDFQSTINSSRSGLLHPDDSQSHRASQHQSLSASENEVITFPFQLRDSCKTHDSGLASRASKSDSFTPSSISHLRAQSESTITPSTQKAKDLESLNRNMIAHQRKESKAGIERANKAHESYF